MKTARSRRSHSAFTLIELLVVISIIAILASLTFTGVGSAMLSARRLQAKNDMSQIALGITSYYTEYGKYPIASGTTDLTFGTQSSPNDYIISVLRDKPSTSVSQATLDTTLNPRQIQFMQPKLVSLKKGGVYAPSSGGGDGIWYDPWGTQYAVFIDADYAGDIDASTIFTGMTTKPPFSVGVASRGYYYAKQNATPPGSVPAQAYDSKTDLLSWQ